VLKINGDVWNKHWCEVKHLVAARELNIEIVAFVGREICGTNDLNLQERMIRVMHDLSDTAKETEDMIKMLTEFTMSEATATIEVTEDHYRHFLEQLGHLVCAEEHVSDHLKGAVVELKRTEDGEKRKEVALKVNKLLQMLDKLRLTRQNTVNRFLSWKSESGSEEVKT